MHLPPVFSRLTDLLLTHTKRFKQMSWKSPPILSGLFLLLIFVGGFTRISAQKQVVHLNQTKSFPGQKDAEGNLIAYQDAYKLEIDGSVVAVLPAKEDIDKVLKEYEDYYVKPSDQNKITSVGFTQKVTSEKARVPASQVQSPEQVFQMLVKGKSNTEDYTVQPNDSWWLIARKSNMLTKDVLAGNPGTTEDTQLQPGQIIKLVDITPFITVQSKVSYTETETIPYDTVTKIDYSLGSGQAKIINQGSNGSKLVTYTYVQNNGENQEKQIVAEKVIESPVTKVVAAGPVKKPVNIAAAAEISRGGSPPSSSIVEHALGLVGAPYVFGGTTRAGFDCSGFTQYVFTASGLSLPRTSFAQFATGAAVSKNNLQPGDLVFFTTYAKGASHVGIYVGGGRFVHADNPRVGVTTTSLSNSFYTAHYIGARRYR